MTDPIGIVRALRPLWAGVATTVLLGAAAAGCGASSGHEVPPGAFHNLSVENDGNDTLDVYVDGGFVGEVDPGETADFDIVTGVRSVHLREHGEERRFYGDFLFDDSSVVEIRYAPGVTTNLVVENDAFEPLHVYIDGVEVGEVFPGEVVDFWIDPGIRDVHFREEPFTQLDYVGTFDFPAAGAGSEVELLYSP